MAEQLTTRQAAALLGVGPAHVRYLLVQGVLRGTRTGSRHRGEWSVDRQSVEAYMTRTGPGKPRRRQGMYTYHYEVIAPSEISATDLAREVANHDGGLTAARIIVYRNGRQMPEAAEALWVEEFGRFGVAWGADADWYDATGDADEDIDTWLNNPDALQA